MERAKNIFLKEEWICAAYQAAAVKTAQHGTRRSKQSKERGNNGLETELQLLTSKTRFVHTGTQDRCWRWS